MTTLTNEDQKKMTPEDVGFMMGNNAVNDAIHNSRSAEELTVKLTELRYAAVYVLAHLSFNQAKLEGPAVFNVENMTRFNDQTNALIIGTITSLNKQYEAGQLKHVQVGEKI